MHPDYNVLLYYGYTHLEAVERFRDDHHRLCLSLELRGRVIVATEGINGTVSGTRKACQRYIDQIKADRRFQNVAFKIVPHHGHAFHKMHVRIKREIVHAGLPDLHPCGKAGRYITPQTLQQIKDDPDVVLLDARSCYEHQLGRFKGAITLNIRHFREFPSKLSELMPHKKKRIVTYCTGGVKCEKASAYLLEQGFERVYQLQGGIIQYGLDTDGRDFEGQCYVFDNRVQVSINQHNPTSVSQCWACKTACDRMVNCANPTCNAHVPLCFSCGTRLEGACSAECRQHPQKRPYDGSGRYLKRSNSYDPHQACRGKRTYS